MWWKSATHVGEVPKMKLCEINWKDILSLEDLFVNYELDGQKWVCHIWPYCLNLAQEVSLDEMDALRIRGGIVNNSAWFTLSLDEECSVVGNNVTVRLPFGNPGEKITLKFSKLTPVNLELASKP